jgi:catechol 2,3-dioxygenase-like lactoylglutathione lyase family enzyme/quinol monooxygenase YgiN
MKLGLLVRIEAKPEYAGEVEAALRGAQELARQEEGTVAWFSFRQGPATFGVFDTFESEDGRRAHLNGKIAAALEEMAQTMLSSAPVVVPVDVLGYKGQVMAVDAVKMNLEVRVIPVSDVDRAKEFYQRLGWRLDEDVAPMDGLRIVQFTPPGSNASVTFGQGLTPAAPGSALAALTVTDIEAAHKELTGRGISALDVWHGAPLPPEARLAGADPGRASYGSFTSFEDPDGNTYLVQEVTTRRPGRV